MEETETIALAPVESTNALASFAAIQEQLGIVPQVDTAEMNALSSDFLPRIMVMQPSSGPVAGGKVLPGSLVLVEGDKENPINLGSVFDAFVVHIRAKAMYVEGQTIVDDVFSMTDPTYIRIRANADNKVDGEANMYGAEFLLYLMKEQKFATFFFANPTLRKSIAETKNLLFKFGTFQSKKIVAKGRTWYGLTVFGCNTPYENGPSQSELKAEIARFQSPKTKKREAATVPAGNGASNRR